MIEHEHPQLIALLAGQMRVEKGLPELLAALPAALQGNGRRSDGRDGEPCPTRARYLERCLLAKLQTDRSGGATSPDAGPRRVADVLSRMRRSVENLVLASLE